MGTQCHFSLSQHCHSLWLVPQSQQKLQLCVWQLATVPLKALPHSVKRTSGSTSLFCPLRCDREVFKLMDPAGPQLRRPQISQLFLSFPNLFCCVFLAAASPSCASMTVFFSPSTDYNLTEAVVCHQNCPVDRL